MGRKKNKVIARIELPKKIRVRRMPKPQEFNMGTEVEQSTRPDYAEAGSEPTQCANGHWTIESDLDENGCCSQCPNNEKKEEEVSEEEKQDAEDYLYPQQDYYDDGSD